MFDAFGFVATFSFFANFSVFYWADVAVVDAYSLFDVFTFLSKPFIFCFYH